MAPITLHDVSVDLPLRAMKTLRHVLTVASAHPDAASFPSASLIDDMKPLAFHVQVASNTCKGTVQRLTGQTQPAWADDETTMDQLLARVDKTIALLEGVGEAAVEGGVDRDVHIQTQKGTLKFDGRGYLLGYGIPNLMFHVMTVYAILRAKGVEIGKGDYLSGWESFRQ